MFGRLYLHRSSPYLTVYAFMNSPGAAGLNSPTDPGILLSVNDQMALLFYRLTHPNSITSYLLDSSQS
jgi:hypothetical protein